MMDAAVARNYKRALAGFIASAGEASLASAYEIGRDALQKGLSLSEVGDLHYAVTHELATDPEVALIALARSREFFLEVATVYDMAVNGYRETIARLRMEIEARGKVERDLRQATAALSQERDQLEQRVAERTESLRLHAEELSRKNDELKMRNRELDDFAYIASHDLKEPLRAISNHAHLLLEDCGERLDQNARHRIDRLQKLAGRMTQLIADLLHFSRLGHMDEAAESIDLRDILDGIKVSLADTLLARDARVVVAGPLPMVRGNRAMLAAVFQNLISNGTQYNDAPEKIVEIGASPGDAEGAAGFVTLHVRDNGIGIDAQFHDEIFRIFKRLNNEKAFGEGTGAGLTFVKKIVENHGGRIWLTSRPGEGTTFHFTLPRPR
jgi:signal transduction histidine kinase